MVVRLEPMTPIELSAAALANLAQLGAGVLQRLLPTHFSKLAVRLAQQRLGQAVGMVGKIEGIASLDAEKVAVDAALVAVVAAQDLRAVIHAAHAQGGLASVSAVGADGGDVVHLPGAGFVTIGARGERSHRADVNAHAALFAVQVIALVGGNGAGDAAVLYPERPHVHAFTAGAHAAVAEDTARPVEEYYRGPLLFLAVLLDLGVERLGRRRT